MQLFILFDKYLAFRFEIKSSTMSRTRIPIFFNSFSTLTVPLRRQYTIAVSQKKALKLISTQTTVVVTAVLTNGVIYGVVPNN